jgi:putative oxygen-independent coproporphyrinogen III oxidase
LAPSLGDETAARPNSGFGVYVHFPWCLDKCGYCDFYSVPSDEGRAIDHDGYADAVIAELERRLERIELPRLATLYVGGGTPSLWHGHSIERVIRAILSAFSANSAELEITVECNPSSFTPSVAEGLLAAGVNRISLGIQSLDDGQLKFLGRRHDRRLALEALDTALTCGITRVSADMLFGLDQPTLVAELAQIVEVASRPLSHVSAYALTLEQATPFGRLARQGQLAVAVDERVAETFLRVHEQLERLGYEHYEISNYARPGMRSRHNLQYWWGLPYLGLGAAAFGTVQVAGQWLRYRNPASIARYLGNDFGDPDFDVFAAAPQGALESLEPLDAETRFRERLMLGLRLREGIDLEATARELGVVAMTPARRRIVERLIANGRLSMVGERYAIDPSAWLLADGTIAWLM